MKINVITLKTTANFNAEQKAPSDIVNFLKDKFDARATFIKGTNNTRNIFIKLLKRFKFTYEFIKARLKGEIVILQFPMFETTTLLNKLFLFNMNFLNKKKTIILIHDLDGIRNQNEQAYKQDLDRINKVNYVIVHNEIMKKKLEDDGVKAKIYVLELFDYLCDYSNKNLENKNINFNNPEVIYAGNLAKEKSPFIHQLDKKKMKFTLNLYGVGIGKNINNKIIYIDKYHSNELPNKIKGNLGLIWDGNLDDSDKDIGMKNYTKYNNPHKLSCYMAAGIPVIAWEEAAISNFIKKHKVGYVIKNIYDINNINYNNYEEILENAKKIQVNVRNGYYTTRVIKEILNDIVRVNK